jgi:hypothetical protein
MHPSIHSRAVRMRYEHFKEQGNELWHRALPHIASHGAGCHPPSHALWYESVGGSNRELRAALDGRNGAASTAGSSAARCGQSLSRGAEQLASPLDLDAVRRAIAALAAETRRMQTSNARLTEQLEVNGPSHRDPVRW